MAERLVPRFDPSLAFTEIKGVVDERCGVTDQLNLLDEQTSLRPAPSRTEIDDFVKILSGIGWVKCSYLRRNYYQDMSDRKIRAMAAGSEGRVISGQHGYRLTTEATDEECQHAVKWLQSQATEMSRRAKMIALCRIKHFEHVTEPGR